MADELTLLKERVEHIEKNVKDAAIEHLKNFVDPLLDVVHELDERVKNLEARLGENK